MSISLVWPKSLLVPEKLYILIVRSVEYIKKLSYVYNCVVLSEQQSKTPKIHFTIQYNRKERCLVILPERLQQLIIIY